MHDDDEEKWIPIGKALEVLQVKTKSSLYYYVSKGEVKKKQGKNDRDHLYNVADIQRVRAKKKGKVPQAPYTIEWLKPEALASILELDMLVFHQALIGDYRQYQTWLEKNPYIAVAAFENGTEDRRKCLGYISLLPLLESTIFDILFGMKDESDISIDEIQTYDHPGNSILFASALAIHPNHPELISILFEYFLFFCQKLLPERHLQRIYAQPISSSGRIFVKKLYFSSLYNVRDRNIQRIPNAYVLDLEEEAGSRMIRKFQGKLKEGKDVNDG